MTKLKVNKTEVQKPNNWVNMPNNVYKNTYWVNTQEVVKVEGLDKDGLLCLSTGEHLTKDKLLRNYIQYDNIFYQFKIGAKYIDRENSTIVKLYVINGNNVEYCTDADTHYTLSKKAFRNKFFMLEKGVIKNTPKFDLGEIVYWYDDHSIQSGKLELFNINTRQYRICTKWYNSKDLFASISSLVKYLKKHLKRNTAEENDPDINTGSIWMSVNRPCKNEENWEYQVDEVFKDDDGKWIIRVSDGKTYTVAEFHNYFCRYLFEIQPGLDYVSKVFSYAITVKELSSDIITTTEGGQIDMDTFFAKYDLNEDALVNTYAIGEDVWYLDKNYGRIVETNVIGVKYVIDGDWWYKVSGNNKILPENLVFESQDDLIDQLYQDNRIYE